MTIFNQQKAQVHLIGNIIIWYTSTITLLAYISLLALYLIRRKRQFYDLKDFEWQQFKTVGHIFVVGYLMNFIPYFVMERTLFLHNYLIAYTSKLYILVFMFEFFYKMLRNYSSLRYCCKVLLTIWILAVIFVFYKFSVLSYGLYPLTERDIQSLEWKKDWSLISHKSI